MIRYDRTTISVVIYCECGWSDVAVSKEAGWSLAEEHEIRAHPESRQIREAARMRENYRKDELTT